MYKLTLSDEKLNELAFKFKSEEEMSLFLNHALVATDKPLEAKIETEKEN